MIYKSTYTLFDDLVAGDAWKELNIVYDVIKNKNELWITTSFFLTSTVYGLPHGGIELKNP